MAFTKTGVVTAPSIVPSAFGLLAVAKPENAPSENEWTRGFAQEWETTVENISNWDDTDTAQGIIVSGATVNYYDDIKPFFVEVDETRSTLGFNGIDRVARISSQLEGITQKAMETELWDGEIRISEGHDNKALTSSSVSVLNGGTALSAKRALALLEHSVAAASQGGELGAIHLTRDVSAILASNSNMIFHDKETEHLQTSNGASIVVGSGYSGNGPRISPATASVSTNVLTINTSTPHFLTAGDAVILQLSGTGIALSKGTYTVASVTDADTFTVALTASDASSTAVSGYVQEVGSATEKWIYATGLVKTFVGDVDVVNDNLSQAYDVSGNANDMRLKAIRPVAAYFDPSIHLAVKVDLTA